jgi:8-oxo-dGTP pyrophosphatase MutT (NUDIX family)
VSFASTTDGTRPAATVVLVGEGGPPQVLFLQRHKQSGFMARAHVFPGGRVDAADADPDLLARVAGVDATALGVRMGMEPGTAVAHVVAAIRETFEEAGILLGQAARADRAGIDVWRDRLNGGDASFAAMAEACDLRLDGGALTYFAHWVTPPIEPKRYDTRFFLARAPRGQRSAHDGHETTASVWLDAAAALSEHAAGRFALAPPTWRILGDVAAAPDEDAFFALAAPAERVPRIMPHAVQEGGALVLALPGDPLHPDSPNAESRARIVLREGCWRDG